MCKHVTMIRLFLDFYNFLVYFDTFLISMDIKIKIIDSLTRERIYAQKGAISYNCHISFIRRRKSLRHALGAKRNNLKIS